MKLPKTDKKPGWIKIITLLYNLKNNNKDRLRDYEFRTMVTGSIVRSLLVISCTFLYKKRHTDSKP